MRLCATGPSRPAGRSGRTDDRAELDGAHRHARCLGTFGRRETAGLLFGLEDLDRDPVRVVDGYEVGAQESGAPLYPWGSSGFPVGSWVKLQPSAVEEDGRLEVLRVHA